SPGDTGWSSGHDVRYLVVKREKSLFNLKILNTKERKGLRNAAPITRFPITRFHDDEYNPRFYKR
ncbi:hypothetical protein STEG23_018575, partial [Scotinomys teguina]